MTDDVIVRPKGRHNNTDAPVVKAGPAPQPPEETASAPETGGRKSALGGIGSSIPFGKRKEEDRKGTWGDSGYRATDDQAHRNVTYNIPSFMKQTWIVFMVQMKLFSKQKWTYFMLFVAP